MPSKLHGRSIRATGGRSREARVPAERAAERRARWQLLAAGVLVGGLALLAAFGGLGYGLSGLGDAAASAGRSLEAAVRSPGRDGPPPLGAGWRQTPEHAVIFYGGYFCASGPAGRRVRLVLSLRELDTLTQGSSRVVGPALVDDPGEGCVLSAGLPIGPEWR